MRAYQQHLSRVTADSQVEIAKVAEQHVQETSRTARALAEQVASTAVEQTERAIRHQEESLKNLRDPFEHDHSQRSNGHAFQGNMQATDGANGSMHAEAGNDSGTVKGSMQGGNNAGASQQTKSGKPATDGANGSMHVEAGDDSGTVKGNLQGGTNAGASQQTKSGKPA